MQTMINDHLKKLYPNLMNLCKAEDSPFYFVDQILDDKTYRIFSYRLASYTEFLQVDALECRGIMFEIDFKGNAIRLASLPMAKFFNAEENPMTMNLDYSKTKLITDKMDGSLISTFWHNGRVCLKSKTSLHSEQAQAAQKWLDSHEDFYNILKRYVETEDITVNLEWTSTSNRIVLNYPNDSLTVLNMRQHCSGNYFHRDILELHIPKEYLVPNRMGEVMDKISFANSVKDMKDIEGFVLTLDTGSGDLQVKIKCDWYSSLHRLVSSINSAKALFECVVNEAQDDLKPMFVDNQWALDRIAAMEVKVKELYSEIQHSAVDFYNTNKELDRKSFAIKGTADLDRKFFGIAMSLYLGKEFDYKQFLLKNYKEFGIKEFDTPDSIED